MNVGIGTAASQLHFWKYINRIFSIVQLALMFVYFFIKHRRRTQTYTDAAKAGDSNSNVFLHVQSIKQLSEMEKKLFMSSINICPEASTATQHSITQRLCHLT